MIQIIQTNGSVRKTDTGTCTSFNLPFKPLPPPSFPPAFFFFSLWTFIYIIILVYLIFS